MFIWRQKEAVMEHSNVDLLHIGRGYSGHGAGVNNPEMQGVPNVGPLPRGDYRIGPLHERPGKGPKVMALTPIPNAVDGSLAHMHGRSGFLIHGDNSTHDASQGCIILPRAVREVIGESTDKLLRVIE